MTTVIILGKKFKSIREACEYYGISHKTVQTRMRYGMNVEDAITRPVRKGAVKGSTNYRGKKPVTVCGKQFDCIQDACKHHNIQYVTVHCRIRRGVPLEEAITSPTRNCNTEPIKVFDRYYKSVYDCAMLNNLYYHKCCEYFKVHEGSGLSRGEIIEAFFDELQRPFK